jgi:DNA mismatch endonuclease (patch repair protein)
MKGNGYLSDELTSKRMSAVRPLDTTPEKVVRKAVTRLGFRYRLHRHDLPGRPDLVFVRRRKVILVHGCYWHRHEGCRRCTTPVRNAELWHEKFARTVARDAKNLAALAEVGWRVLVVWECETTDRAALEARLAEFLNDE